MLPSFRVRRDAYPHQMDTWEFRPWNWPRRHRPGEGWRVASRRIAETPLIDTAANDLTATSVRTLSQR